MNIPDSCITQTNVAAGSASQIRFAKCWSDAHIRTTKAGSASHCGPKTHASSEQVRSANGGTEPYIRSANGRVFDSEIRCFLWKQNFMSTLIITKRLNL